MDNYKLEQVKLGIEEKELELREFFSSMPRGTFYTLLILLILTIPIFFITKAASTAIAVHNYQKTAVTAHPAIVTSSPVQILDSHILTMAGNSYAAFALIKNANKDLVTGSLQYTFSFLDAGGNEIAQRTDSTYILGGEQKYLIVPQITLLQAPTEVKVTIPDPAWQKRISLPSVVIQQGIPQYGDQTNPDGFYVQSTIQNTSPYTLGTVRVDAIIKDPKSNVIAVSQYTANALQPKETRAYKMYWPIPLSGLVGPVPQIIVETNILDQTNLK